MNTARILLADDDEIFLRTTTAVLRASGYRCDMAVTVDDARSLLRQNEYELLLTDVRMPGNHDLEFLRETSQQARWLPIVVVTGFPTMDTAIASVRLSVADYLVKPIEDDVLLQRVGEILKQAKAVASLQQAQNEMHYSVEGMERMEHSLRAGQDTSQEARFGLNEIVGRTMSHIAQSLANLQVAVQAVATGTSAQGHDVCRLLACPRLQRYRAALDDTLEVLEKTKQSFKSKDLAQLRRRLEEVIDER